MMQDAHEAIRPTDMYQNTGNAEGFSFQGSVPSVSADLETFYSQPHDRPAVYETTSVKIAAGKYLFTVCSIPREIRGIHAVYIQKRMRKKKRIMFW